MTSKKNIMSKPNVALVLSPTMGGAASAKYSPPLDVRSTVSNPSDQYPTTILAGVPINTSTLILPTLQLAPLECLKPSSLTSLNPFPSSLHLSPMNPKPCSSSCKISSRNSLMLPLPTYQPCLIKKHFLLLLEFHSRSSPSTFRTTRPTFPRTWISTHISKLRLPLKPTVFRRPRIIWLALYPFLPQLVLLSLHPRMVSVW